MRIALYPSAIVNINSFSPLLSSQLLSFPSLFPLHTLLCILTSANGVRDVDCEVPRFGDLVLREQKNNENESEQAHDTEEDDGEVEKRLLHYFRGRWCDNYVQKKTRDVLAKG